MDHRGPKQITQEQKILSKSSNLNIVGKTTASEQKISHEEIILETVPTQSDEQFVPQSTTTLTEVYA